MRLSILIPCYNAEKYVEKCLDTIFRINLPLSEYEVICFDDHSMDSTSFVLDAYAREHKNMFIIHSFANVGPGGGRNKALQIAKGNYVWFVDADDQIIPEKVQELINESFDNQLDVLIFDYCDVDEKGHYIPKNYNMKDSHVLTGPKIANLAFEGGLVSNMGYPVRFIIRKDFLTTNHIYFPQQMKYGEDTVWMAKVVLLSERIKSTSICAYKYIHHDSSTCGIMNNLYPGRTIYERCILVPEQIMAFAKDLDKINYSVYHKYSYELSQDAINNYLCRLPIMFGRMNCHERSIFYNLFFKQKHEIVNFANPLTKVMLLQYVGKIFSFGFSFIYKLIHQKRSSNG